ncbi:MAG: hypothetical protein ACRDFX_05240 [Chloroflexota bacterium]
MKWRTVLAVLVAGWLIVLGIALQPAHRLPPPVAHTHRLDVPARDLATLSPAR